MTDAEKFDAAQAKLKAEKSIEHQNLPEALLGLQGEIHTLKLGKDAEGEIRGVNKAGKAYSYKYGYLTLEKLADEAYPLLNRHGLVFIALPDEGKLRYEIIHAPSGQTKGGAMNLPPGTPQEQGSAISYFRRYAMLCATGIVPAGEDDDAAKASIPRSEQPTTLRPDADRPLNDEEKALVVVAMKKHGDPDMLLRSVGCDDLDSLTVSQGRAIMRKVGTPPSEISPK